MRNCFGAIISFCLISGCGPTSSGHYTPTGESPDLAIGARGGGPDFATTSNSDFAGTGTPSFTDHCKGQSTTVTGTVYAPNGIDPVAKALVYVPTTVNPIAKGVSCDLCDKPVDDIAAQTTAAPDGTFTLDISGLDYSPQIKLAVSKGRFRRVTNLTVNCGNNTPAKTALSLPGKSADGDLPKIAVGTGTLDHLDQVLVALGITEFTCLEGRKSVTKPASCMTTGKLSDLLVGANGLKLDDYNMVFIGCAPGAYANYAMTAVSTMAITQNLQGWTAKGGRLFVTDNSYDYLSQSFPQQLAWQGPAAMPWPVDGANIGVGTVNNMPITINAKVDDMDLAAWLKVVGVNGSPMVSIAGFKNLWSVQKATPMGTAQIVDGTASWTTGGVTMMGDVPLTSDFKVNMCGKVVYSSYHTLDTVNTNMLTAQEKILEYLMLEVAACTSTTGI